ncbi:MAG: NAD(P)/FAD-dependent oxidoreductase [Pyrinomonadaceae bacterium]|nr:NAD(P)/FAD-dependent oxidoreductase [Pyrinomonadaceae bacterium]
MKEALNSSAKKVAIVGSGFLGLTLALRLSQKGHNVTVYESSPEIGGLASVWKIGDITWDRHYHVVLLSDHYTRKIIEEVGLKDEFEWVETKTGFYTDGELVSMSNTFEFLTFKPLDLISKFRLGATIFYASKVKNWRKLEKVTVEQWLTKLSGKKTFDKMWRPLLKAKLGEAYQETCAAFIWATIQRMYAARNSGLKKEMFGYVRGGYASVLRRFAEVLEEKGVEIRLNSRVAKIESLKDGRVRVFNSESAGKSLPEKQFAVEQIGSAKSFRKQPVETSAAPESNDSSETFDKVILTCPSNIAAKILPQLSDDEKKRLAKIRYLGIVCASVLTKKPISHYYVTNITDETPFTGVIELSALVDKKEFGGNSLIYLPKYVAPDHEIFDMSDEQIEEHFLSSLEKMYSHFDRNDVLEFKISRVRQVFPLLTIDYSKGVPDTETSIENVFIVNSSQIVNGTLNINETVQLAEKFPMELI